jgi:hypothetical protein
MRQAVSKRRSRLIGSAIAAVLMLGSACDAKEPPAKASARTGVTRGGQSGGAEAVVIGLLLARKAREKRKRSAEESAQEHDGVAQGDDRPHRAGHNDGAVKQKN